jgi:2'-5' RNA ligase
MSLRLFIAIELGQEQRDTLERIQGRLKKQLPAVRWVKPASVHLTLRFLGSVKEQDLERVKEIMNEVSSHASPFALWLREVGAFPNLRNPRVIWLGVREDSGTLMRIVERLDTSLKGMEVHSEERSFTPHLTLGRVKEKGGSAVFASILPLFKNESAGDMSVTELSLIRSDLTPHGPIYTVVHRAALR